MKKTALLASLLLASSMVHAAEWRPIGNDVDSVWFIDLTSIVSVASSKFGWVKMETRFGAEKASSAKYSITRYAAHCKTHQLQLLAWADYSVEGRSKYSNNKPSMAVDVYPDSLGEAVFTAMCYPTSSLRKRPVIANTVQFTEDLFENLGSQ